MAKSDSFFIRASTDFNGTVYNQTAIDLGAYVDALGKSVLRIHNITVQWGDPLQGGDFELTTGYGVCAFQLTTQSQSQMVDSTNKSVVSAGKIIGSGDSATPRALQFLSQHLDVAPQHWTNGYLIGVEQMYLGVDQTFASALQGVQIILECTVETLSQSAAMALALSQQ